MENKIKNYMEENCEYCSESYNCKDLDGDIIDEKVKICMETTK